MFSPIGKKKVLVQQKFGGGEGSLRINIGDDGSVQGSRIGSPSFRSLGSPSFRSNGSPSHKRLDSPGGSIDSMQSLRDIRQKLKDQAPTSAIASTVRLEEALSDVSYLGHVLRKIMEATSRYRPERDSIMLKAFESRTIDYTLFRNHLNQVFWLTFTNEEFEALINYFDPTHSGIVDGYSFMKAFVRLNGIRKDRESQVVREKQEAYETNLKAEEERKRLEKDKRLMSGVDYNFTPEIRKVAMEKFESAAKKFDPAHPSAPSLHVFNVSHLKPLEFREMMKLIFNLKLDPQEAGAVLRTFKPDIENEIPASDFLKFFLRFGFESREKEKSDQRKLQETLDKKAEEERIKKQEDLKNKKLSYQIDYNFDENDENNALRKMLIAAEKYDKSLPGSVALDGFECEELNPIDFKDLVRRVFNLQLSPGELGFIVQKYDTNKSSSVHCKTFLNEFLALGYEERHKKHIKQLEKQRKLNEQAEKEHLEKIKSVSESESVPFSAEFTEDDLNSALKKLTHASVFYDKSRGITLSSFEPISLSLLEFKRGIKRTFNFEFTAKEMGAIFNYLQKDSENRILCQPFLTVFTTLGAQERGKIRTEQINRQRSLNVKQKEEMEKKRQEMGSKTLYEVDFEFDESDRESAIAKMTKAATKYDSKHPAAMSLQAFEVKHFGGPEFKELVRKTFNLQLTPKEVGAVFAFIREKTPDYKQIPDDRIDSGEFLKYFLQLGISERMRFHSEQLEKQRSEDEQREEANRQKLLEAANRQTYQPDMSFTEEDKKSIQEKIAIAAEKFDKNHPAAPSLEAFTAAYMFPGVFRENIKNIFGIKATPKEIGVLLEIYDKDKSGRIQTKEFLIKFFALGKKIRDDKKRETLIKQREALKQMQKENEDKLQQLIEKTDYEIDNDFTEEDYKEAVRRMTIASEKYDKTHPAAPNLDGFTGGPVSAGAFRELMKRAFNILLTPKEVGAIVSKFHTASSLKMIDGKQFLIFFIRLGFDARARRKAQVLMTQRQSQMNAQQEQERKLLQSLSRVELEVTTTYTDTDREKAIAKLTTAAALYDKNAPGAASLDSFHCLYLTPGMFREVMKRTFSIIFTPSELAAMIAEFNNGSGNIDTSKFLVNFIRIGSEEREKFKLLQLEKDRNNEFVRKMNEKKKKEEQEQKMLLKINYNYTKEQKEEAFRKLAVAAKKYDKAHPAAMALDGFEQKTMKPHVLREMLKRTFNFVPSAEELGAIVEHFDKKKIGEIISSDFLVYFLKLGIAEREKEHKESLRKLREDAIMREKLHQDKMALQWAKAELALEVDNYTDEDRASAIEKLTEAAVKFDPASAGPMGLTAFQAKVLTPVIFREMLRRVFNMQLTNGEFAALITEFENKSIGNKNIDCTDFLVKFQLLGTERKNQIRAKQLEKQRFMTQRYELEQEEMRKKLDSKMEIELDYNFSNEDFENVMEKIRQLAVHYDKTHPSAPNLKGFQGADMKPNEFKDMFSRTFHIILNNKELAAVQSSFPGMNSRSGSPEKRQSLVVSPTASISAGSINGNNEGKEEDFEAAAAVFNASLNKLQQGGGGGLRASTAGGNNSESGPRICNRDFLAYFYKLNREEMMKRNTSRIQKEKELKEKEKQRLKELEKKKIQDLIEKIAFKPEDEITMLNKLKEAGKEYAIDSAPYIDRIQSFKGPALPPDKFRELFYSIFNVRFTFAEIGVLLSILDNTGLRVIDGSKFLNWFYKIARKLEKYMLGESMEDVTLEMIKSDDMVGNNNNPNGNGNVTRASTASLRSLGSRQGGTRKSYEFSWEKNPMSSPTAAGGGAGRSNSLSPMNNRTKRKKERNLSQASFSTLDSYENLGRSQSFEMDNPLRGAGSSDFIALGDGNSISTQTIPKSASFDYLPPSSPSSPSHHQLGNKPATASPVLGTKRPVQVRHSSLEAATTNSPKKSAQRMKGFSSLSYSNPTAPSGPGLRDFDDFSIETNDTSTFAKSTLSQQWFLPSITLPSNDAPYVSAYRDEDTGKIMREELKELFDRKSTGTADSNYGGEFSSLDSRSLTTADWKKNFTKTAPNSADYSNPPASSHHHHGGSNNNKRKATGSHAKSTPNLVVPNLSYSLGNEPTSSPGGTNSKSASSESKPISNGTDSDFLKSVFDMSEVNDPSMKSLPKGQDPVAKLNKVTHHLHNSPAALVAAKQQKQNGLKPMTAKPSTAASISSVPSTAAGPSASHHGSLSSTTGRGSPSKQQENANQVPSGGGEQQQQQQPGGGFFFPTLLSSKIALPSNLAGNNQSMNSAGEQPILSNVPNIGIVGTSEIDPSILKEIIMSK